MLFKNDWQTFVFRSFVHVFVPRKIVDVRYKPQHNVGAFGGGGVGKLTAIGARSAKPGRHADGDGLYLLVSPTGARSWMLRVQVEGRRRDVGLGALDLSVRTVQDEKPLAETSILLRRRLNLVEARRKAALLRDLAKSGRDPIRERDKDRSRLPTFADAAQACHDDLQSGWAQKNAAAFLASLREHAYPAIGTLRIDQVEASNLRDMLAPIWVKKPEMAKKVRQRASTVLNYAKAKGWRKAEAPGKSVTIGLARSSLSEGFAAMPYKDVPAFVTKVSEKFDTVGRLALLFTIYTAARSGEVRNACWAHIDLENALWNRPASLMKNRIAHSITLTVPAMSLLKRAGDLNANGETGLIFPSAKNTALSDMTLSKVLRDAKAPFTVHGFRSSFRDFAAEQMPDIPDPVAEAALAHLVADKVERAYKRTTFLQMRFKLLNGWAAHLGSQDLLISTSPLPV